MRRIGQAGVLATLLLCVGCAKHDREYIVVKAPQDVPIEIEFYTTRAQIPGDGWYLIGQVFKGSGNGFAFFDYAVGPTYGTTIPAPSTYTISQPSQFHIRSGTLNYRVLASPKPGYSATIQLSSPSSGATFGGDYEFIYISGNWPVITTTHTTIAASGCSILILRQTDSTTGLPLERVFLLRQSAPGMGIQVSCIGTPGSFTLDAVRHYVEVVTTTPTAQYPVGNLSVLDQERVSKAEGLALETKTGP